MNLKRLRRVFRRLCFFYTSIWSRLNCNMEEKGIVTRDCWPRLSPAGAPLPAAEAPPPRKWAAVSTEATSPRAITPTAERLSKKCTTLALQCDLAPYDDIWGKIQNRSVWAFIFPRRSRIPSARFTPNVISSHLWTIGRLGELILILENVHAMGPLTTVLKYKANISSCSFAPIIMYVFHYVSLWFMFFPQYPVWSECSDC